MTMEQTADPLAQATAEYDAGWNEAVKDEEVPENGAEKSPPADDADTAEYDAGWDDGVKNEDAPVSAEEKALKAEEAEAEKQRQKEESERKARMEAAEVEARSKTYGNIESMEKALNDTKSYASRLQAENAALQRKVEAFERGDATAQDVEKQAAKAGKAQEDFDKIKGEIYEDYPEMKPLFDMLIEKVTASESTITELRDERDRAREMAAMEEARRAKLEAFERDVKPKVVEKHKDFDSIVRDDAYWRWAEGQSPALRYAAMDSPDPQDIIWAIGEFKATRARNDVQQIKDAERSRLAGKLEHMQTLRGGSTTMPRGATPPDSGDYDSGWDAADAALKRQGLL